MLALVAGIAVVLMLVCLGIFVVIAGRDFNTSVGPLIGYATPTVTLLFAYAGLSDKLNQVHKQVNGNYSALQDKNTALVETLKKLAADQIPDPEGEVK